ncbi:MAG: hypothetical protein U0Z17_01465 [Bacteroidales bacterium]
MKPASFLIILFCLFTAFGQAQNIVPAPNNKAVVYFVRYSSMGFAINFSYFDSTRLVGRFNCPKYIRYECEPGKHLFWARSENRDYVEAEVEAGKIYFIVANPRMGAVKAQVELVAVDPKDAKIMKKILELLDKKPSETFTAEELAIDAEELKDATVKGMAKYIVEKADGVQFPQLTPAMNYEVNNRAPE